MPTVVPGDGTLVVMRRLLTSLAIVVLASTASPIGQAPTPAKLFMWTVSAAGAPPTYLMGSLHVLTPEYYPLNPRIDAAFARSTVLVEEVDLDEMTSPTTAMALLGKAMFTDGRTLDQVIAPELYQTVVTRAEKAGLPAVAIQRMKPWMAAVTLTMPALKAEGFNANLGVDRHFFDRAKTAGLERRGLETVAYQFDRLDQMSPGLQEAMLRSVVADLDAQLANVREMADAWARGDTATLEKHLLAALKESPELYERLLVERNRNWVEPVERCLLQKTACFVVVGAAHLVGPDSLVAMLRKRGYVVEQQ
jgi:uncharacterized protein